MTVKSLLEKIIMNIDLGAPFKEIREAIHDLINFPALIIKSVRETISEAHKIREEGRERKKEVELRELNKRKSNALREITDYMIGMYPQKGFWRDAVMNIDANTDIKDIDYLRTEFGFASYELQCIAEVLKKEDSFQATQRADYINLAKKASFALEKLSKVPSETIKQKPEIALCIDQLMINMMTEGRKAFDEIDKIRSELNKEK
jgi:hypothetical protein